jgi:hypothetical protein
MSVAPNVAATVSTMSGMDAGSADWAARRASPRSRIVIQIDATRRPRGVGRKSCVRCSSTSVWTWLQNRLSSSWTLQKIRLVPAYLPHFTGSGRSLVSVSQQMLSVVQKRTMTTCSSLTDFRPSHTSDISPTCHSTRSKPCASYSSRRPSNSGIEISDRTRRVYGHSEVPQLTGMGSHDETGVGGASVGNLLLSL